MNINECDWSIMRSEGGPYWGAKVTLVCIKYTLNKWNTNGDANECKWIHIIVNGIQIKMQVHMQINTNTIQMNTINTCKIHMMFK